MNSRVAKKIRKYTKRNYFEYLGVIKEWPFTARLRLCWWILFGKKKV